jgi:hypothetical protein
MSEQDTLGARTRAALALSNELGGARVTMRSGMSPENAAALGREIRAGLEGSPALELAVSSITVEDDPPYVAGIAITIRGADERRMRESNSRGTEPNRGSNPAP